MTEAIHIQAADAVVQHIADQSVGVGINQTVIAARKYVARYDVESLATDSTARVTVVPTAMKTSRGEGGKHRGTRGKVAAEWCLDVAVHRYTENDEQNDLMVRLVEQIDDLFRNERLPGLTSLHWTETEYVLSFDPAKLDEHNVFLSVMQFKFGGFR